MLRPTASAGVTPKSCSAARFAHRNSPRELINTTASGNAAAKPPGSIAARHATPGSSVTVLTSTRPQPRFTPKWVVPDPRTPSGVEEHDGAPDRPAIRHGLDRHRDVVEADRLTDDRLDLVLERQPDDLAHDLFSQRGTCEVPSH